MEYPFKRCALICGDVGNGSGVYHFKSPFSTRKVLAIYLPPYARICYKTEVVVNWYMHLRTGVIRLSTALLSFPSCKRHLLIMILGGRTPALYLCRVAQCELYVKELLMCEDRSCRRRILISSGVPVSSMCGSCTHAQIDPGHAYKDYRRNHADLLQSHCTSLISRFDHIGSCALYSRNVHQIFSPLPYFLLVFPVRLYILFICEHLPSHP
ncbi:hypothetical protein ARMGADRAFT_183974 [Armillaria gallica]|uniref:Uncharacterized protein n=1 Tax=Armillaria gallica TaxID=47427 RepID=A0A2H3DAP3_ARMGA|nr:hypothetical protein ARMGADRAFT_183974 [Armillaria gallica]